MFLVACRLFFSQGKVTSVQIITIEEIASAIAMPEPNPSSLLVLAVMCFCALRASKRRESGFVRGFVHNSPILSKYPIRLVLALVGISSLLAPVETLALPIIYSEAHTPNSYNLIITSYPINRPFWPDFPGSGTFSFSKAGFSGSLFVSDMNMQVQMHYDVEETATKSQSQYWEASSAHGGGTDKILFDTMDVQSALFEAILSWGVTPVDYVVTLNLTRQFFKDDAVTSVVTEIEHANGPSEWHYEWAVRNDFDFSMNGFSIKDIGGLFPFQGGPISPGEVGRAEFTSWQRPIDGHLDVQFVDHARKAYASSKNNVKVPTIPIPPTLILTALGLAGLGLARFNRKRLAKPM
jgi:hypothetical protein